MSRSRRVAVVAGGGALLVLAVLAAAVAVLSVRVEGESMQPTLSNNDRVLLRPFTGSDVPHRFALIVGRFEEDGPRVVKRVIGLPGDRVQIQEDGHGHVQVEVQPGGDGAWQQVDNPTWRGADWAQGSACCTNEGKATGTATPVVVPAGMLFLLGDNAPESRDSLSFGWAPIDLVQGVAWWRVWPWRDAGRVGGHARLVLAGPD